VSLESRVRRLAEAQGGPDALSITEFYRRIDRALKGSFPGELWITGEIRSIKVLPKGHCFIDLVDPTNARDNGAPTLNVKCWSTRWRAVRSTLDRLGIALDAGMVVRVRGDVQFYKPRGTVDFILSELDTEALLGKVAAERARLIKALVDEGLFERQRQLRVTDPPLRIGLVASPGSEGYHDFLGGLRGSGLAFDVTVAPTTVQGKVAPARVASAIRNLQRTSLDVIVVVRGGGSKADLAAFDAEPVARAIATSDVPVWTGIGHTGDQSVADEVAARSFITPTECGQELSRLAIEFWRSVIEAGLTAGRLARARLIDSERVLARHRHGAATGARAQVDRHSDRLTHRASVLRGTARGQIEAHSRQLSVKGGGLARSATRSVGAGRERLTARRRQLATLPLRRLEVEDFRVAQWQRLLGAYDYQRQLDRGYSVTRDPSGSVVRSASGLTQGSVLVTQLSDGQVASTVTTVAVPGGPGPGPGPGDGHGQAREEDEAGQLDEGTQ
jgi:exodeoxyribonuclease VII large subunit